MNTFFEEVNSIQSVETLTTLKENIKMEITEPQLHWEKRMFLYKKVQFINSRIKQII
jgi:hypothetical protein